MSHPGTLILIMTIAVVAPLCSYGLGRWTRIPLVIFEILLGVLVGPDVLDLVQEDVVIDTLANLGLSMLIFLAGYEIAFGALRRDILSRAGSSWLVSLLVGVACAFVFAEGVLDKALIIGTALTSTTLGTLLPILRDNGDLADRRFGPVVMAFGAVGEFGPIIAMAVLLSSRGTGESAALLAAFAAITVVALLWALRPRQAWFTRIIATTLHSSAQFAVRFVMLLLAGMLALSQAFGLDTLLGAFAAGLITRIVLTGAAPESSEQIVSKIEAIGYGFLVPVFFIVTGIEFDLAALLDGGRELLLLPAFLLLLLLVRGLPAYLLAPRDVRGRDRAALALYTSTSLPLVVAICAIGVDSGVVASGEAAALIGAAMLSVLLFPLLALRMRAAGARHA